MKCRLTRLLAVLAAAVLLAGCPSLCGRKDDAPPDRKGKAPKAKNGKAPAVKKAVTQPEAILKAAQANFPDGKFTNLLTFEGNQLYSYMNGAAETYYARGFLKLAGLDVKWKDTEAKVEFYLVKEAANAAALFEEFDDGKGKKLPAGLHSAAWDARELEGIFHRGPYFCRLIIYGNDAEAHQLLRDLAAAIDKAIPK